MCLRSCVGKHLGTYRLLSTCSIRWQQNGENNLKWVIHKLQTPSIPAKTCLMHMFKISFVIHEMLSAERTSSFAALAHQKHKTFNCLSPAVDANPHFPSRNSTCIPPPLAAGESAWVFAIISCRILWEFLVSRHTWATFFF